VQQDFTNWWIYWVGPIVGGLIAAFLYTYLWMPRGAAAPAPRRSAAPAPAASAPVDQPVQPIQPPKRRSSRRR
jgi:hypothetical protein